MESTSVVMTPTIIVAVIFISIFQSQSAVLFDEDGDGAFDYSGCDYGGKTMRTNALVLIFVLECIHRLQILIMIVMKKNQNKTKKHLQTPSWEKSGTAERIHRLCCANTHVVCEEGRTQVCHWFILFLAFDVFFLCVFSLSVSREGPRFLVCCCCFVVFQCYI